MVKHDGDEALTLADRLLLMTDRPEATVGEMMRVPFPPPRTRAAVIEPQRYRPVRRQLDRLLEHHAHQSRPSALDSVLHPAATATTPREP